MGIQNWSFPELTLFHLRDSRSIWLWAKSSVFLPTEEITKRENEQGRYKKWEYRCGRDSDRQDQERMHRDMKREERDGKRGPDWEAAWRKYSCSQQQLTVYTDNTNPCTIQILIHGAGEKSLTSWRFLFAKEKKQSYLQTGTAAAHGVATGASLC